ncbi:hypothetical protein ACS0PU_007446 [Formica fusca]
MAKSPISVLQELSVKQGYVPIYNYTGVKKVGIYNQFVCRVECKQFNAEVLSPVANKAQISTPTKICEPTSPSRIQALSNSNVNYVGLLQEFCVQQKLMIKDILYEVVDESGPPHMRIFTIEASIGSVREKDKLLKGNKNTNYKMLEDTIRKLGIGISECIISEPALPVANLSKKAQTLYMKCNNKELKVTRQDFLLKDLHNLFEETYSNKISFNMREKMQTVRDKYTNHADIIEEVIQDIVRALEVKIEKTILPSLMKGYIICLRLSSNPIITQFGMDETKDKAEIQAKYNIIVTVLALLNIS